VFTILLFFHLLTCVATGTPDPNDNSRYLNAVREFADNVLKYGRDTYGPKHTPLFVDGLNIHTHEPVKWISPKGDVFTATETEEWILSNFASQQTLLRTLDGLSTLTGDPKYRDAAKEVIKYAFENLRSPNGLFYWGITAAYDAQADKIYTNENNGWDHTLKYLYPYYQLMWEVDPEATAKLIEAIWSAHVLEWRNLDINRIGNYDQPPTKLWDYEYSSEPTFFKSRLSWSRGFLCTASSLAHAAVTLSQLDDRDEPLMWVKRLIKRYVDTRHSKTGISYEGYNIRWPQLRGNLKSHFDDPHTTYFPFRSLDFGDYYSFPENTQPYPWLVICLLGEMLGDDGKELIRWGLEEFSAWGRASYRREDNSFVPILTDGTCIEGHVWKRAAPTFSSHDVVVKPCEAELNFFWSYCVVYRITGDNFIWDMVRQIGRGNGFGDIGETPRHSPELVAKTTCSHPHALLGFLELYQRTKNVSYLQIARDIGDNIASTRFHKGYFAESKGHVYARFDCLDPLALLRLSAMTENESITLPPVWPNVPVFAAPYRRKESATDHRVVYALTESPTPDLSIHEASVIGDVDKIISLINRGIRVDSWDGGPCRTALHYAVICGRTEVVNLLLKHGAYINARDTSGCTPLHYAFKNKHYELAEFLIEHDVDVNLSVNERGDTALHSAVRSSNLRIIELIMTKGADVAVRNDDGQTALDIAMDRGRTKIVKLLANNRSSVASIYLAAFLGDQARVRELIESGTDINAKDQSGMTPLLRAISGRQIQLAKFLVENGANISIGNKWGQAPLIYALWNRDPGMVQWLLDKGADTNTKDNTPLGYTSLHWSVRMGNQKLTELVLAAGADVNLKGNGGKTALQLAKEKGHTEIVELLRKHGARE
jgi:pectate lyase